MASGSPGEVVFSIALRIADEALCDAEEVAATWLQTFVSDLSRVELRLHESLTDDCYWRDLLAFTQDYRTKHSILEVEEFFAKPIGVAQPTNFRMVPGVRHRRPVPTKTFIQGIMKFDTAIAHCTGVFTLVETVDSSWKAWTLVTMMDSLIGVADRFGQDYLPTPFVHLPSLVEADFPGPFEYGAIILGAGQCGLSVAARLENLGISALIIEKAPRVGDSWRFRYESLQVNTPKSFSHLPYVPFPNDWGQFFLSSDVADHLERYPGTLGLRVVTSSQVVSASYDHKNGKWIVSLLLKNGPAKTVTSRHLIAATGVDTLAGATPAVPDVLGSCSFRGTTIHSSQYRTSRSWSNKNAVVVGAGCSGHDIAQDLAQNGAKVVLVQRSATSVISRETLYSFFPGLYFGENIPPTEVADRYWVALPLSASRTIQHEVMSNIAHIDEKLTQDLSSHRYLLPGKEDNFLQRLLIRRSGYYIDRGCCDLIISGKIAVKSGRKISRFSSSGLVFDDGSESDADLVVYATGYSSTTIRRIAEDLFGNAVSDRVDDVGGWDDQWEYAGLWRPSGHQGLWFVGGDLFTARFYSKFLALQIKARDLGLFQSEQKQ
ncbi:putative dimethylaniline monooxygenase (N-oxide-forming) [Hygrophoropsis aurantiaca]|uniref:Dimethylaniline monooxygenase (N-oxide-forming) n=1 Tax=Hygrophoropsis aurantiaca TaxID=72124 RepID=A0ACB8A1C9_9AGAM|nr:putative dimethylaniline monooxygenase (N-oxide-forming) [Hygrophoropsis aurantiaca]